MATPVLIPVSEYLRTSYRPDCDYIDGEVKERNVGETPHGTVQGVFFSVFLANRTEWGVRPFTEQRVQTSKTHYRIADVCAVRRGSPAGPIICSAPLVCIEIYSRDDSRADMKDRINDYIKMGVENIWLFDPIRRLASYADAAGIHPLEADAFSVPGTLIRISLADLNIQLDELEVGL